MVVGTRASPLPCPPTIWWLLPLPALGDLHHPLGAPEEPMGKWSHQMEKLRNEVNSYRVRLVVSQGDGRGWAELCWKWTWDDVLAFLS